MIIEFKDARICAGDTPVVHSLNMQVDKGDFVYIVGKVGSGKTSIIRTINAEFSLKYGEGHACGYNLRTIKDSDIPYLRRHIGVVFQDFQLLMDRSVYDNLEFVLKATDWTGKEDIATRISNVLMAVGMKSKAHKMPYHLSGGEQQRIAIARALLNTPDVILADEPTGNLDAETSAGIMELLTKINQTTGTAIIMVTHNNDIVSRYPGRVFVCGGERCEEIKPSGDNA